MSETVQTAEIGQSRKRLLGAAEPQDARSHCCIGGKCIEGNLAVFWMPCIGLQVREVYTFINIKKTANDLHVIKSAPSKHLHKAINIVHHGQLVHDDF
jgi:hypothetical protein